MDRPKAPLATTAALALAAMALLSTLALTPAVATHADDVPEGGTWAQNGSVFDDWIQLSADDPSADPVDWYRINLSAEGPQVDMLRVSINLTIPGTVDINFVWAAIHDPDGFLLSEVESASLRVKNTATVCHRTGTYFVRVYTYSRYVNPYEVAFNITKVANTTDGDDTIQQARFLDPPTVATGHVNGVWDPYDHYAVNLTRDNRSYDLLDVVLWADQGSPGTDLDLYVLGLDAAGRPIQLAASASNGSYEVVYYAADSGNQTVYIRVHAYGGIANYSLSVGVLRVPDDGNNNINMSEELRAGTGHNDTLNLTDPRDFYRFNLTGGDLVAVTVTTHDYDPATRKPNFDLYLLSPTGTILNWSFQYDPVEHVEYVVPLGDAPAAYHALVTYHDRTPWDGVPAWGGYTINVTVDHAPRVLMPLPLLTNEDTPLTVALGSLLMDPEGPLGAVKVMAAVNATVTLAGGNLTIATPENFTGDATFVLQVVDGTRLVDIPITVHVASVPDAPELRPVLPPLGLDEDSFLVLDLDAVFVDGDGDPLTFSLVVPDGARLGNSSITGSDLTVVPDPDFFGDAPLLVTARDPSGLSHTAALVFHVRPVPDAPRVVWADPSVTADEDARGVQLDLGTVFFDPDGDLLYYTGNGGAHISYIILGSTLIVDGEQDFHGTTTLTVTARDPGGLSNSTTVRFTFRPVNDPPRVVSSDPQGRASVLEGAAVVFTVNAEDPEGSLLTYSWYIDADKVPGTLPRYEFMANYSSQGSHLVSAAISDGNLTTWVNWTLDVTDVNRPPLIDVLRPKAGDRFDKGANVVFEAVATDPDGESPLVSWKVDGATIGSGTVFTTSGLKVGKHALVATATDSHNATANATVSFEVKAAGGIPGAPTAAATMGLLAVATVLAVQRNRRRNQKEA